MKNEENKLKILFDLSYTQQKFSGVQQDMLVSFKALLLNKQVNISGLYYLVDSLNKDFILYNLRDIKEKSKRVVMSSQILSLLVDMGGDYKLEGIFIFRQIRKLLASLSILIKRRYYLLKVEREFNDVFYRKFLENGLGNKLFDKLLNIDFYITNLVESVLHFRISSFLKGYMPQIDTSNFDAVVFQFESPIEISPNTLKIIRHIDLSQILLPDMVVDAYKRAKYQFESIKKNLNTNSVFVALCNTSRGELLKLFPQLENRVYVIPCSVSDLINPVKNFSLLETFFPKEMKIDPTKVEYILYVGSMEYRKNIYTLLKAFEVVSLKYPQLKLVLAGHYNIKDNDKVSRLLSQLQISKKLIIVQSPSVSDLCVLYAHAKLFVYPSYMEGFGIPPIEAMKCGCPVISSNIAVHREVQGNAALFFDPYNYNELVTNILLLLSNSNERETLIKRGYEKAKEYSESESFKRWDDLLIKLKKSNFLKSN
jgi:glycosyltransferase involved in cell wall biosynthesis